MRIFLLISAFFLLTGASCSDNRPITKSKLTKTQIGQLAVLKATLELQKGKIDDALQTADSATVIVPEFGAAWRLVGAIWLIKNNPDLAIRNFQSAIELNPKDADAFNGRGAAYSKKGELEMARADFSVAIELNPGKPSPFSNRGGIANIYRRYDSAIKDFSTAIRLNPKSPNYFIYRSVSWIGKGEFGKSKKDLEQAYKLNPRLPGIYRNRAQIHLLSNKYEAAIRELDKAIRFGPESDTSFISRARTWLLLSRKADALTDLLRANRLKSEDPYLPLWIYIAGRENGKNYDNKLEDKISKLDQKEWPKPLYEFFLGKETVENVLTASKTAKYGLSDFQKCMAHYFIGKYFELSGDTRKAISHLQKAAAAKINWATCYIDAQGTLLHLGVKSKQAYQSLPREISLQQSKG